MSDHEQQENMEQMFALAKGAKGEKGAPGEQGERGEQGMARGLRYGLVVLFTVAALFAFGGMVLGFRGLEQSHHSQKLAQQALADIQHHGALCTAFGRLAAEPPPPGSASTNPSRAYLQNQHAIFVQLHQQLGCGR